MNLIELKPKYISNKNHWRIMKRYVGTKLWRLWGSPNGYYDQHEADEKINRLVINFPAEYIKYEKTITK